MLLLTTTHYLVFLLALLVATDCQHKPALCAAPWRFQFGNEFGAAPKDIILAPLHAEHAPNIPRLHCCRFVLRQTWPAAAQSRVSDTFIHT